MGRKTNIGWTESTWNAVTGCTKVSAGCKFCYVERVWPRLSGNDKTLYFSRPFTNVMPHESELSVPVRWTRPRMIFVNSMSDTFHPDVSDAFINKMFASMLLAGHHTYQVLTKRVDRAVAYMNAPERFESVIAAARSLIMSGGPEFSRLTIPNDAQWPLANVWFGVSAEDQPAADERIWQLMNIPAVIRFVSAEPLVGKVEFSKVGDGAGGSFDCLKNGVDWVIVGCETGAARRKLDIDWVRHNRSECHAAGVSFFLKQLFINGKLVSEPELDGRQSVEFPALAVVEAETEAA